MAAALVARVLRSRFARRRWLMMLLAAAAAGPKSARLERGSPFTMWLERAYIRGRDADLAVAPSNRFVGHSRYIPPPRPLRRPAARSPSRQPDTTVHRRSPIRSQSRIGPARKCPIRKEINCRGARARSETFFFSLSLSYFFSSLLTARVSCTRAHLS